VPSALTRAGVLALRIDLAPEWHPLGVGQDAKPILFVARMHPAAEDARVDLREQIKVIFPGLNPINFSVGAIVARGLIYGVKAGFINRRQNSLTLYAAAQPRADSR
jgi:hypothetical protein